MCFILTFHEPHVKQTISKKPFYILTFLWSYPLIHLRKMSLPPPVEGPKPHAQATESYSMVCERPDYYLTNTDQKIYTLCLI